MNLKDTNPWSTQLLQNLINEAQILVNIIKMNTEPNSGVCVLYRDMTIGTTKAINTATEYLKSNENSKEINHS